MLVQLFTKYHHILCYVSLMIMVYACVLCIIGCSEYTIIPARYAYLLHTNITDGQAAVLERKFVFMAGYFRMVHKCRILLLC